MVRPRRARYCVPNPLARNSVPYGADAPGGMMRRVGHWWLIALVAAGCGRSGPVKPPAREPLRIAAASDLQAALPEIVRRFETEAGIPVAFTPGASGNLAQQVRQGGPFDVFLAANRKFVEDLAAEGIIR